MIADHTMPAIEQVTEISPLRNKKNWNPWRALVAYWILGLCNNYGYVVMLSAAHDIIKDLEDSNGNTNATYVPTNDRNCNYASTGIILLADIIPALAVKFSAPFLPFYVHIRVALCVLFAAGGLLLVAFATNEALAITGVVLTSLSSGLGEVSFLQYSSFYNKNVVSTWSSGTGGAGILGSVSYATLATLGLKTALLIMLVIPAAMAIAFWIILPQPDPENLQVTLELQEKDANVSKEPIMHSVMNKVKLIPGLMKFMIPLGLVYLFEYFINQGLFELIKFDNIFLTTNNQYHWLQVDYQIGVFISRSSVNLIHIRRIWLMSILQLINVIIFTFEAVYFYVPNIWIIFTLVLWEGLLGGAAYVNTFYKISQEVPEDKKQFSMSVTSVADTIGITLAGIAAIPSHNAICSLPKPDRLTI